MSAYGGNVGAHVDINPELSECGGFIMLEHLLHFHYEKPQCYLAMLSLLVGQPISSITLVDNFSLDLIWSHVFGLSLSRLFTLKIYRLFIKFYEQINCFQFLEYLKNFFLVPCLKPFLV